MTLRTTIDDASVRRWHRKQLRRDEIEALDFIALADGEGLVLAYDVAQQVGWEPRSAGAKLRSLYLRGYLRYWAVPNARLNGWELTDTGRLVVG